MDGADEVEGPEAGGDVKEQEGDRVGDDVLQHVPLPEHDCEQRCPREEER